MISLAHRWLANPGDHSITTAIATEYVELEQQILALREKYAAVYAKHNETLHEVERLRAYKARYDEPAKIWPVHIKCDGKCGAVVAFDPAPEEAKMVQALHVLGWGFGQASHWCPRCGGVQ